MKCTACGYEHIENSYDNKEFIKLFIEKEPRIDIGNRYQAYVIKTTIYACPNCGTLKINNYQ